MELTLDRHIHPTRRAAFVNEDGNRFVNGHKAPLL